MPPGTFLLPGGQSSPGRGDLGRRAPPAAKAGAATAGRPARPGRACTPARPGRACTPARPVLTSAPVEVWLVRHGETEWSRTGRHTGRTDVALLPSGCAQAEAVGRTLGGLAPSPSLVLTSPLRRAVETCALAGYATAARGSEDLVEWDYGEYEGRTTDEIREEHPGWTLWVDGVPGGETASEVARRADRVIELARCADGDVVLFSHGHLLRVLAARWVGLPPAGGRLLALGAGGLCMLGFERGTPVVGRWNVRVRV
jgi:broad specificity phosphatase PhoE